MSKLQTSDGAPQNQEDMTHQQMLDRISLLSGEMDANDEENQLYQKEIIDLYAKIDALKVQGN